MTQLEYKPTTHTQGGHSANLIIDSGCWNFTVTLPFFLKADKGDNSKERQLGESNPHDREASHAI